MRKGHEVKVLGELAEVRRVQKLGAEMAVARAESALRALEDDRERGVEQLRDQNRSWEAALLTPYLGWPVARAWSAAIVDGEAELLRLGEEILNAEADRARCAEAWRFAQARHDLAEDTARSATRRLDRRREETALLDLADRISQRGRRP